MTPADISSLQPLTPPQGATQATWEVPAFWPGPSPDSALPLYSVCHSKIISLWLRFQLWGNEEWTAPQPGKEGALRHGGLPSDPGDRTVETDQASVPPPPRAA